MVGLTISLEASEFITVLCEQRSCVLSYCMHHASSPWPTLPRPFSLDISNKLQRKGKKQEEVEKKVVREWSESTVQFSHHQQLATGLWPRSQLLCQCIAGQ